MSFFTVIKLDSGNASTAKGVRSKSIEFILTSLLRESLDVGDIWLNGVCGTDLVARRFKGDGH